MKNQCDVENFGFQFCVFAVRTEHQKDVFCEGKVLLWVADEQGLIFTEMSVGMIGIYCDQRQFRDHFDTLTENVFCGGVLWFGVVGVQSEDASLHCVHDIAVGSFHDNVTDKTSGQGLEVCHNVFENFHVLVGWKSAEQKEVNGFLKTEFTSFEAVYDIVYIISLIVQSAVCRDLAPVDQVVTCNIGNFGKSCQDTFTCGVTKTSLYIVFYIEIWVDPMAIHQFFPKKLHTVFQSAHLVKI